MPEYLPADELKRRFPGISSYVLRHSAFGVGDRPPSQLQEQQNADQGKAHHQPQETTVDEAGPNLHRIGIALRISDDRERDGDGCEATLLDCLIHARKRLLSLPDWLLLALYESSQRERRSLAVDQKD